MATLYFDDNASGAYDGNWNTTANWWTNAAATTAANAKPSSSDSVVLQAIVSTNSGSTPTVVNLQAAGYWRLEIQTVVTGTATFAENSQLRAVLTGTCVFQDDARLDSAGEVTGNVTFNNNAWLLGGTIHGNATFNDSAQMIDGIVDTGNATFNGSSKYVRPNNTGQISLNATFNGSSKCCGQVNGLATFNGSSTALAGSTDGSEVSDASLQGNAIFNNTSQFNCVASSSSTITMRNSSSALHWAFCQGTVNFYDDSYVLGSGNPYGPKPSLYTSNFYDNSYSQYTAEVATATFYDNAKNITGHMTVILKYGRGINGSSILGVV